MEFWKALCFLGTLGCLGQSSSAAENPVARVLNTTLPLPTHWSAVSYPGGDYIYIFGGVDTAAVEGQPKPSNQVLRFSLSTETLEVVGQLPISLLGGVTSVDSTGNVYILRGPCILDCSSGGNETLLKFDPKTNSVQEIPIKLPFEGQLVFSVVSYQKDPASPAYLAATLLQPPGTLYLMKVAKGEIEAVGHYTDLGIGRKAVVLEAMEVIDDEVHIKFNPFFHYPTNSSVIKIDLQSNSVVSYQTVPPPRHNPVGLQGTGEDWQLLPSRIQGGVAVIDKYDVGRNIVTSLPVDHYPPSLQNVDDFLFPAYVYVGHLRRIYVFGGITSGGVKNPWNNIDLVWTIQMPVDD